MTLDNINNYFITAIIFWLKIHIVLIVFRMLGFL